MADVNDCPECAGALYVHTHYVGPGRRHLGEYGPRHRFDNEYRCQSCRATWKDVGKIGEPDLVRQENADG